MIEMIELSFRVLVSLSRLDSLSIDKDGNGEVRNRQKLDFMDDV